MKSLFVVYEVIEEAGGIMKLDFTRANTQLLMLMMSPDEDQIQIWPVDELAEILSHQLNAPLMADLARVEAANLPQLQRELATAIPPIRTGGDLLSHPSPPLAALQRLKLFAKISGTDPETALPRELSTLLYLASISAAWLRHGQWITRQDRAAFVAMSREVLKQSWLTGEIRDLIAGAITSIESSRI